MMNNVQKVYESAQRTVKRIRGLSPAQQNSPKSRAALAKAHAQYAVVAGLPLADAAARLTKGLTT
jgi:hypothetical protein